MSYDLNDTIAAIGTAAGGAPRGMVRLSGPEMLKCLEACFRVDATNLKLAEISTPRLVTGTIAVFEDGSGELPCDLLLWPGQHSYTRQPTAELHTLGSAPLLEQLLQTLCSQGARLAEPGEFTLRAFLAGRLDLTQAEAVLGVIDASSSHELQTALTQLAGGLSQPLGMLREQLLQLLAELEAGLDFVEEDIEFITAEQMREQLSAAQATVAQVMTQLSSREDASDLPRVVLSGLPNAGKSSLFNALIERYSAGRSAERALVSDQSGTTRDYITAAIQLNGIPCELVDTAGVDAVAHDQSIDQLAQDMTDQQKRQAQILVHCVDSTVSGEKLSTGETTVVAYTKTDLLPTQKPGKATEIACSSKTGEGLEQLASQIAELLSTSSDESGYALANTAARCTESLRNADASLVSALQLVESHGGEELIAAEVRGALHALGQVVGTVYTDDILDRIFGQFCIGK